MAISVLAFIQLRIRNIFLSDEPEAKLARYGRLWIAIKYFSGFLRLLGYDKALE